MAQMGGPGRLRDVNLYLTKALKFYDLKNERLGQLVFIIILITNFLGIFVPDNIYMDISFNLIRVTVISLASAVYITAYIRDIKGEDCETRTCFGIATSNALKILGASVSYLVSVIMAFGISISFEATAIGASLFGIPLLIVYLTFLFNVCYVVDKDKDVASSYRESRRATYGYKKTIFFIIFIFNFVLAIPLSIIMMMVMLSNNELIYVFVFSFVTAVFSIMQQRLTALMYVDMTYGSKDKEDKESDE